MVKIFYLLFFFGLTCPVHGDSVIDRMNKAQQSLVSINTTYVKKVATKQGSRLVTYQRAGTGILLNRKGIIVTNTHIILNAPQIIAVTANGQKYQAQVIYVSPTYDFSFIKIAASAAHVPARWADSNAVTLGQTILAIGRSDYTHQSLLSGTIKSILYSKTRGNNEFLELGLNLYKGDSGGPILDTQGNLVGIIMAKRISQDRSALAITSNILREQYLKLGQNWRAQ